MLAEKTAFPLKTSLVTHLFLSDLRMAVEFHYIYVLHRTAEAVVDTSHFLWFSVTSRVQYYLYSYNSSKVYTKATLCGQSLLSSADPGAVLAPEEKPEFLVEVTIEVWGAVPFTPWVSKYLI